ncbi:MAG: hypothetical protein KatS3mg065_1125 [Chloroflexota bacterium]|nr:MAG: hypothetical protein KatS3mg065_1125 [Chloroflexota bacterium]
MEADEVGSPPAGPVDRAGVPRPRHPGGQRHQLVRERRLLEEVEHRDAQALGNRRKLEGVHPPLPGLDPGHGGLGEPEGFGELGLGEPPLLAGAGDAPAKLILRNRHAVGKSMRR